MIGCLRPSITDRVEFLWRYQRHVPRAAGCYVLAAYDLSVLYIGLASNLSQRMANHLDDAQKRVGSGGKVPFWFYSLVLDRDAVRAVERGWLNESILRDGGLPPLNRVHSPV